MKTEFKERVWSNRRKNRKYVIKMTYTELSDDAYYVSCIAIKNGRLLTMLEALSTPIKSDCYTFPFKVTNNDDFIITQSLADFLNEVIYDDREVFTKEDIDYSFFCNHW